MTGVSVADGLLLKWPPRLVRSVVAFTNSNISFLFFLCEMSAGDVALFPSWGEERVINIRRRKRGGLPRDRADFSRLHHPQLKRENVKIRAGL